MTMRNGQITRPYWNNINLKWYILIEFIDYFGFLCRNLWSEWGTSSIAPRKINGSFKRVQLFLSFHNDFSHHILTDRLNYSLACISSTFHTATSCHCRFKWEIFIKSICLTCVLLSFRSIPGKRYSESLAGSLLPDWIGKSLFIFIICKLNFVTPRFSCNFNVHSLLVFQVFCSWVETLNFQN